MYLDKVEIHGFKSFGEAIKLDIPQGITAVIGPNGSGKSNVADAIRWVLGEQSAKTLRGTKMEDIIFAGTQRRKPLGYAEVVMHIKNEDRKLPIDYKEVSVKRRVYRSGESEYFLNNSVCRLKDIHELFMDTGVGREGYSIIGQGQIDKVLSSKPEDRRSLFEEAAGIYKYKMRRVEAERKLEKERENITRLNDIISEIEDRLEPLGVEAEKTKAYLEYKEELKSLDVNLYMAQVDSIKKDMQKIEEDIINIKAQSESSLKQRESLEAKYSEWKKSKDNLFASIEQALGDISKLEMEQEQKNSEIALSQERVKSIESILKQIEEDSKKHEQTNQDMQIELQMLKSKKIGLELEKSTQKEILRKAEENQENLKTKVKETNEHLESAKTTLYEKVRKGDLLTSEKDKQEALEDQLSYREEQVLETIAKLNKDITHQEVSVRATKKEQEEKKTQELQLQKRFVEVDKQKLKIEQEKQENSRGLSEVTHEWQATTRQIRWLEQIKNDYEGYYKSVKQVLKLKDADAKRWQGIVGVVADLLNVPKEYEMAIVTALGGAMQNIVTYSEKDAKQMIHTMKQKGIARVTFLPKDTVQSYGKLKELESLKNEKGFLGVASELVNYDVAYQNIVEFLLGKIVVVDTIDNASAIAKKYKYRFRIVTLQADVFNAGGSLSGGSTKHNTNNIFSRARELKEAIQTEKEYSAKKQQIEEKINTLNTEYEQVIHSWNQIKAELVNIDHSLKELHFGIMKEEESLKLIKSNQLELVKEKNNIDESREKLEFDKESIEQEKETIQTQIKEEEEKLDRLEKELQQLKETEASQLEEITDKKINLSHTLQQVEYLEEQRKKIKQTLEEYSSESDSIKVKKEELLADKDKILSDTKRFGVEIEGLKENLEKMYLKKQKDEALREEMLAQEEGIQKEISKTQEQIDTVKEEQFRLEHKKELLEVEKQKQSDTIWEQYELTYGGCLLLKKDLGTIEQMKKTGDKVRGKIRAIGSVNVNAIEEFKELNERYEFLTTQREDVKKAEETLLEMIEKLTEQMHAIFREQFTNIAKNFSEVFKDLFGGGTAFLHLTDEKNILESGIEIIAQPPGKKLQNMTLLSGGERALTAIALIFGILRIKPSPFCVLDEIEAALDDANVLRFSQYLKKLGEETQFIVITHRKGTMERADTLYGVTMQERGISKVLSIQLEDAGKYVEKE